MPASSNFLRTSLNLSIEIDERHLRISPRALRPPSALRPAAPASSARRPASAAARRRPAARRRALGVIRHQLHFAEADRRRTP